MMERIEQSNQEKIRTLGEKVTFKYLGILEADTIKQAEGKEEFKIPKENEKTARNQRIWQKSPQRDEHCGGKLITAIRNNTTINRTAITHHHHHIALVARTSLTLSRHSSSFIALGRSSGQHPVSSHSCWMYVRAGRPAFARPCVGVHKSTWVHPCFSSNN